MMMYILFFQQSFDKAGSLLKEYRKNKFLNMDILFGFITRPKVFINA